MSDDLIEFLRARLDDDERTARAAAEQSGGADWRYDGQYVEAAPERDMVAVGSQDIMERETGEHIARHDPARVLREIDAKRKVLDLHGIVHRDVYWLDEDGEEGTDEIPVCGHCVPRHSYLPHHSKVPEGPCTTVRLLAVPYADHPDYLDEWRP